MMASNILLLSSSPLLIPPLPLPAKLSILSLPFSNPLQLGSSNSHRKTSRPNKKRFIGFSVGINVSNFLLCDVVLRIHVDPWSPTMESQSIIASQLFALSLFPYLGFLYFITKSNTSPKLTLFGFYFLLAFVGATIPAGIYAKVKYGTSLSNVDWLHGSAESLLTLTNLFIVLGLRQSLRKLQELKEDTGSNINPEQEEEKISV